VSTELVDVARLRADREEAARTITRGFVLVLLVPVVVVLAVLLGMAFDTFSPLILASLYGVVGGAVGVASVAGGVVRHRLAARELHRLEAERIPEARLLR
jgi:hypothetical protein